MPAKKKSSTTPKASTAKATSKGVSTSVRSTSIPPKSAAVVAAKTIAMPKAPPAYEHIAVRAYYIWQSSGGSEFDNWIRAERELV